MTCEEHEYLTAAKDTDAEQTLRILFRGLCHFARRMRNVRKQFIPAKPDYNACRATFMDKLSKYVPAMYKPLAGSRIVEQSFTADGYRYLHDPENDQWNSKLISFNHRISKSGQSLSQMVSECRLRVR